MESWLVSVLIVTWNRKKDVLQAIQSIYDQPYSNFEIIVVDNGSTDGTQDVIRKEYPAVRLITCERNTGITAGRNTGIAAARGEIIFCLDSDASAARETMTNLVSKFQSDPDLGVINSKIVNASSKELDRGPGWAYTEKQKTIQNSEFLSFSFSETGCAIRKRVLEQVGSFWDLLFFGREGEELGLRVWDAGYKVLYFPQAIVYHRVSPNERVAGGKRLYFDLRNSLYIYLVRYPWWMLVFFAPLKIITSVIKGIRRNCLAEIGRALFDVIRQWRTLLKQRHPIRNNTARFYLRLQREHGPLSWDLVSWLKNKV